MHRMWRVAGPWTAGALVGVLATGVVQAQEGTTITPSGEVRIRSESLRPVVDETWDSFTLMRTRIGLAAAVNPNVRAFIQFQDARVFGGTPSTMHASASALDLHQGWVEFSGTPGGMGLSLRAGRQAIALGNERLVGPVGWSNTGRTFDAARVGLTGRETAWKADLIAATVHEGGARFGASNGLGLTADHWLSGLYASSGPVEGHLLYDRNAHFGRYVHVDRYTAGGMLKAPARFPLVATLEGSYQFGSQAARISETHLVDQDIRAWFTGARLGRGGVTARLPYLGIGVDLLSGDDDATDGTYRAFNTLYATNHKFYGYMDLFLDPAARTGGRGLVDLMASARAHVAGPSALEIDVHRFLLANDAGLESRDLGWELDLTYPFQFAGAGRFLVGYSLFRNGPGAATAGLGADGKVSHWGFVQAGVSF
jgi:hypothetical protein